jgi:mono/diheme cytochrome c family protein
VVAGLISPGAISALIHEFVWGWAIEWTFFIVEIVAALIYYTTWGRISRRAHVTIGWIYFAAAYLSLVIINGIITFMLTPGRWLETHAFWDGFFNPTYWPSLVLRTGICAMMATSFLVFAAWRSDASSRDRLLRYLGSWLVGGGLVAYAGYRWWEASLEGPATGLFLGASPVVPALGATRSLTLWALALSLALGALLLASLPRPARAAVSILVALSSATFFGGYERLREGVRKPFLIHSHLFSNGLRVSDVARIDAAGMAAESGWVAARSSGGDEAVGRAVFEAQCGGCHTLDGYQAIRPLLPSTADVLRLAAATPDDAEGVFREECASCHPDYTAEDVAGVLPGADEIREDPEFVLMLNRLMVDGTLERLREMGAFYASADPSRPIDTHQTRYPQMPPLVGSDEDAAALATYLAGLDPLSPAAGITAAGGER